MHTPRNSNNITPLKVRHNFFKNPLFSSAISERNKLGSEIHNSASLEIFEKHLLNFIRTNSNNVCKINNPLGLKLLKSLRIGFSHLKNIILNTIFKILQTLCVVVETTLLNKQTLLKKLKSINGSILAENENSVVRTLLLGRPDFTDSTNKEIIN